MDPVEDYEELEIRGAGALVHAICREPAGAARASVVLVPKQRALAVDLARRGCRAVTFDGPAHFGLVLDCVRARADGHAVVALGPPSVIGVAADAFVVVGGGVRALRDVVRSLRDSRAPVAAVGLRGTLFALLGLGPTQAFARSAVLDAVDWAIAQARP